MQVIAGTLGGRRLKAPKGTLTRPTSARVREALFAMLGELPTRCTVLDLFAGTGALGIEALSRGAERAVFIERDGGVVRVLKDNLATLGLDSAAAEVRQIDALSALRGARGRKETYDLVFIDPPYRQARSSIADRWGPELSEMLAPVLGHDAQIVVESDRRAPLVLDLEIERQRRYGDSSITIHRHR
jgi:16S rRNA (guanine966-N2)-methyltransferase